MLLSLKISINWPDKKVFIGTKNISKIPIHIELNCMLKFIKIFDVMLRQIKNEK